MAKSSGSPNLGKDGLINLTPTVTDPVVDIVFVHGLTGDRMATWTKSSIMWPKDLLAKEKSMKKARIFTWGYNSDVVRFWTKTPQDDIDGYARDLCADLAGYRNEHDSDMKIAIIFVMHSLGGLVCQEAILLGRVHSDPDIKSIGESTRGLVFLGTPHAGASLAKWVNLGLVFAKLFKRLNNKNVTILEENSKKLAEIGEKFPLVLNDRASTPETKITVACFYETLEVDHVGIIVPKESATLKGYLSESIPQDHIDMCKCTSNEDVNYKRILNGLRAVMKAIKAPKVPKEGTNVKGSFKGDNFGIGAGVIWGGRQTQKGFQLNFDGKDRKQQQSNDDDDDDDDDSASG